jgi:hypothetical protein
VDRVDVGPEPSSSPYLSGIAETFGQDLKTLAEAPPEKVQLPINNSITSWPTPIEVRRLRWFLLMGFSIWLMFCLVFGVIIYGRSRDQRLWARRIQTCQEKNGTWKPSPFYPGGVACVRRDNTPDTNHDSIFP